MEAQHLRKALSRPHLAQPGTIACVGASPGEGQILIGDAGHARRGKIATRLSGVMYERFQRCSL